MSGACGIVAARPEASQGRDEPGGSGRPAGCWSGLQQLFGLVFSGWLAWALLSFPAYKGMPLGYVPVLLGVAGAWLGLRPAVARRLGAVLAAPRERLFVAGLVALAVLARLACVLAIRNEPLSDHAFYHQAALALAQGRGYPASAYYPPGISFWLAGIYLVFGPAQLVAQVFNALLGGVAAWLTYVVARRVVSRAAARLAAVMTAVFPALVLDAVTLDYGPLLGCLLLATVALFERRRPVGAQPWWYVALLGVLLAGVSFVKPIGLLLPGLLALCYWRRGAAPRRAARNGVILALALLAGLAPWSLRNYRLFGAYVPVTTSGGAALWVANNPAATGLSMPLPRFSAALSEWQRDRILWRAAWSHIRRHPERFLELLPVKAAYMWGTASTVLSFVQQGRLAPPLEGLLKLALNAAWAAVCALFIIGVLRTGVLRAAAVFWPLIGLLAYLWAVHLFYEAQCKYYLPLLPALFIAAAAGWADSAPHCEPASGASQRS